LSGEEVRRATFPQALRGYDRQAVHDMLDRVADWMEGGAGAVSNAAPGVRDEIAKVGERTAGILNAADDAARKLRDEAVEYAERLRADAEDESRKARLNASQRMDEMIADAESKAQKIIDDAIARRRQLNLAISSLIDRRDEIAADATRLGEELLAAVEDLRSPSRGGEPADAEPIDEEPADTEPIDDEPGGAEPELAEEEVVEPESAEEEIVEPESEETPVLLVDPDAEDETPPYGNTR
jgi:DivIVA domain-containing protein